MNLLKAASTVSVLTLASRITGLVREALIASAFGASALTDAFFVAWRIPNLLRRLFAEGAFAQAFVPILATTRERDGDGATHQLVDSVATVLWWSLLATVVVGVAAAPVVVWLVASGLERFDDAVWMTRVMFPYIALVSMVSLAAGILNTWRRFALPAVTPVLLNLAVIAATLWGAPWFAAHGIEPIYAVACGTVLGGVLQLAIQLPALRAIGYLPRLGWLPASIAAAMRQSGVRSVLRQMGPAVLGVSVAQVSMLINTQIASHLAVGSVSWINLADRLMELPTALLGVAMGVVLLPQLSSAQARGDPAAYSAMLDWGLRLVLLLTLPCAVALMVFAKPMLAVLFHHGHLTAHDVAQSAAALAAYGVGLLGIVAVKVLAPGYYARLDIRTPVRIAIVVLVITQALNALLVPWLAHAALTLSIGLGALVNSAWLLRGLMRDGVYRPAAGWGRFSVAVLLGCVVLGAVLWWADRAFDWIGTQAQPWWRASVLAAVLAGVAVLYFGVLAACGVRLRAFMRRA
ncbi:MAG: murein biosynthesis integral membrane protein MurJ [Burkholderiaceae bacterium]|nr:MAG: murein biosynthesis integral membrane protein MurJ [Burkholderiaceae bacterium]MBE7427799.1 murein biosynthesis integral membrane protein MurJ [Ideonella sp.]MCC7284898.1 murein biosynthesis integral membrane protein MurJ [Burkholderiaceae bacterium]